MDSCFTVAACDPPINTGEPVPRGSVLLVRLCLQ